MTDVSDLNFLQRMVGREMGSWGLVRFEEKKISDSKILQMIAERSGNGKLGPWGWF